MEAPITIQVTVNAPVQKVWQYWTEPAHIMRWAFASDGWEAPEAENDVRVGGAFRTRMSAKDHSAEFDFAGTYTAVEAGRRLEYVMADGRKVQVEFEETPESVRVTETFDPETENPIDMQRAGWQAILENFKKHVEGA